MKFGRKRSTIVHPHLKLKNYLRASLPSPPTSIDYTAAAKDVIADIYGNDNLGDCVIAGGYHIEGVATGNAGNLFHASSSQIVSDYSAIGAYVPGDPSTDNGCELQTALAFWQSHGFANGTKLLGYLSVDATNVQEVKTACWLFENLFHGLELPDSYVSPFPSSSGFVWSTGTPNPNNGHCIASGGYDSSGTKIYTWGMYGTLTYAALAQLCSPAGGGELWVMLTPDMLTKGQTKAPNGVDWTALLADWDAMGGNVPVPPGPTPPPDPVPPIPSPPITGAPTLAEATAAIVDALEAMHPLMTRSQAEAATVAALAPLWPTP